jgi:succinylarginine dihydrolase
MNLLSALCRRRNGHTVELFINLMSDFVSRYAQLRNLEKLFGMTAMQLNEKQLSQPDSVCQLFTSQLSERAGFEQTHVIPIEMRRADGK